MRRGHVTTLAAVAAVVSLLFLAPVPAWAGFHPGMTLEEFRQAWETEARTPEGAVRCLLVAVLETVKENNPEGLRMWGLTLPRDQVDAKGEPKRSQRLAVEQFGRQVKGTDFRGAVAASYLGGTNTNGYAFSYEAAMQVDEAQTRRQDAEVRLFLRSGGKDLASPVTLRKNSEGRWKVIEYSSLFTGVKAIESNDF